MLGQMLERGIISQDFYNWLYDNGFNTVPASTK